VIKTLLDRLPPHGLALENSVAHGTNLLVRGENSVPTFPVQVNARPHCIK